MTNLSGNGNLKFCIVVILRVTPCYFTEILPNISHARSSNVKNRRTNESLAICVINTRITILGLKKTRHVITCARQGRNKWHKYCSPVCEPSTLSALAVYSRARQDCERFVGHDVSHCRYWREKVSVFTSSGEVIRRVFTCRGSSFDILKISLAGRVTSRRGGRCGKTGCWPNENR